MQKLVNVIALLSGLTSLAVLGGGYYLYSNKDVMIEDIRKQATEQVTKAMTEALPGIIDSLMPEIPEVPTATGGVVRESPQNNSYSSPNVTGGVVPF